MSHILSITNFQVTHDMQNILSLMKTAVESQAPTNNATQFGVCRGRNDGTLIMRSVISVFNVFVFILIMQGKLGLLEIYFGPSVIDLMRGSRGGRGGGGVPRNIYFCWKGVSGGLQGIFLAFLLWKYILFF